MQHRERVVLVLPIEPVTTGQSFPVSRWPLHVTVVAPFASRVPVEDVVKLAKRVAQGTSPFDIEVGAEALFGRDHSIPVNVIVPDESLMQLHHDLMQALVEAGPRPQHFSFAPHITMKEHARAHAGETYRIDSLAVVDMAPRSSPGGRRVIAVERLGAAASIGKRSSAPDGKRGANPKVNPAQVVR